MSDIGVTDPEERSRAEGRSGAVRWRELLESVQRLTGVGVWSYDVATEEAWWSDQTKRLHGVDTGSQPSFGELIDRYAGADQSRMLELFAAALEAGDGFEVDVELTDGGTRERTVRTRCEPQLADGDVVALHGTVRDITEIERREQRIEVLRRTSQQLMGADSRRAVAEVMADASKNILGLVNTTIRLVDEDEEMLRTAVATEECLERAGERPDYAVDMDNPAARVYRTGEPEIKADTDVIEDEHDRGELVSGLYVPIGDRGVLSAGDVVIDSFDERDAEAASLLGQLGSEALTRVEWANELQQRNEQLTEFIHEMSAKVEEIASTTEEVESTANSAVRQAQDGNESIESVADHMDRIESQVDDAVDKVEQLNDAVAEIDDVIDIIDDIAEQTNILALNASIEAARAGEAGSGFAVVADEIKTLATETQDATGEVEALLDRIEENTRQTRDRIRESTEMVSKGRTGAEQSQELIDEVVASIRETNDGVAEINDTLDAQSRDIEEIAAMVED